jgi:hypothetical protein
MCALETGSEALEKETDRLGEILVDRGLSINENDLGKAKRHWLHMYEVDS